MLTGFFADGNLSICAWSTADALLTLLSTETYCVQGFGFFLGFEGITSFSTCRSISTVCDSTEWIFHACNIESTCRYSYSNGREPSVIQIIHDCCALRHIQHLLHMLDMLDIEITGSRLQSSQSTEAFQGFIDTFRLRCRSYLLDC